MSTSIADDFLIMCPKHQAMVPDDAARRVRASGIALALNLSNETEMLFRIAVGVALIHVKHTIQQEEEKDGPCND